MKQLKGFLLLSYLSLTLTALLPVAAFAQDFEARFQYLSPRPGGQYVLPESNILLRAARPIATHLNEIESGMVVSGSQNGRYSGSLQLLTDRQTLLFKPDEVFAAGETITVSLTSGMVLEDGSVLGATEYQFSISETSRQTRVKYHLQQFASLFGGAASKPNRKTNQAHKATQSFGPNVLPVDYPQISILTNVDPSDGYLFVGYYRFEFPNFGPTYLTIADNYGEPIFYRKLERIGTDFKRQPNGMLTYFEGPFAIPPGGNRYFYGMNENYSIIDSFYTGNGYITDLHELRLLDNGHALLMSYDPQRVRMDTIVAGGNPNALVTGLIIQELDAAKNVVFQWRSWDHYKITDVDSNISLTDSIIDYAHGNTIELDYDGNLLILARNLDEITKIDRQTGDIIWRWGGKNNQFTSVNRNRGFSRHHHIRRLPNGNYTVFDNGNFHSPQYSSALEYKLDQTNMTVELVWRYQDSVTFGAFMGSAQRLENGNTLIGWGGTFNGQPGITEVNDSNEKLLELEIEDPWVNYRAKRFDWQGGFLRADTDTLKFTEEQMPDTLSFLLTNSSSMDVELTTASTRSAYFSVLDSLPISIAADSSIMITVAFLPTAPALYHDVLTLRSDSETEGFGTQLVLVGGDHDTGGDLSAPVPEQYYLFQNSPNPFNPSTIIRYEVPQISRVLLVVYDLLGKEVVTLVDKTVSSGLHEVRWNGLNAARLPVASGTYFYRISAGTYSEVRKMSLMR